MGIYIYIYMGDSKAGLFPFSFITVGYLASMIVFEFISFPLLPV